MPNLFQDVKNFHHKFGLTGPDQPTPLDEETFDFRRRFLQEELEEFEDAGIAENGEGQLDALVDLVYVALGTAHMMGFDFNEAWDRVHTANMQKKRADNAGESKRGSTLDVVKPEGWKRPDLSDLAW